nr:transposase [Klebsiella pneumoniae]
MSGKRYPEEFKIEAVKQVVDRGYSVASVATRLDITTHDWLCERFMLPASQKNNIAEMKRTFLEPALKKINEKTPLKVTYTTEEDGRLLFNFIDKKQ